MNGEEDTPIPLASVDSGLMPIIDPTMLAVNIEQIADKLEFVMRHAGEAEFLRLYHAAQRVGSIAEEAFRNAEIG